MSWDVSIVGEDGKTLTSPHVHTVTGGTYVHGGTNELWLNITYNYHKHFDKVLGMSLTEALHGKKVSETLPLLAEAIEKLQPGPDADYWKATEGNARLALEQLLSLAAWGLSGKWSVS